MGQCRLGLDRNAWLPKASFDSGDGRVKVAVLDMQPIDPPVGGGRLRLLGLYHGLGSDLQATYVGTYDWPGPGLRRHKLSPTLEEINIPLSDAHFKAAEAATRSAGGKVVIDTLFHKQAHLSPDYVREARSAAAAADIVVFSHPWIFPLVEEVLEPKRQLIVYDSHNVEGILRLKLLGDSAGGTEVAREVIAVEKWICDRADLILACSHEDRLGFVEHYGADPRKIKVVPNGVFVSRLTPESPSRKLESKRKLGIPAERLAVIFIGSPYGPNLEAAKFIALELVPKFKDTTFIIAGGVGDSLRETLPKGSPDNIVLSGQIDEQGKLDYFAASDLGINPMFSGSGTNIKMFDFMAAGLATVTTDVGARGISTGEDCFVVAKREEFSRELRTLLSDAARRAELSISARREVERGYAWETISETLGQILVASHRRKVERCNTLMFSVIVPTFERHRSLTRLVDLIAIQEERDLELIIIDQSEKPWPDRHLDFGIDVTYVHRTVRGAVNARNFGANIAGGKYLAFIDDDCEPSLNWLSSARKELEREHVVGLEGLVESSHVGDPNWRPVTNKGFRGMGFMTANLFVNASAFARVDGFDIAFEAPHFREDTDLGWRLLALGEVPFSERAWVYHPPHRRNIERESQSARDRFFEKDPLLLKKHPDRYQALFLAEGHWSQTSGFWPNFLRGSEKYRVELPDFILEKCPPGLRKE
jgi:glycosyltransferase involved in cell wall biosynthesis